MTSEWIANLQNTMMKWDALVSENEMWERWTRAAPKAKDDSEAAAKRVSTGSFWLLGL